MKKLIVIFVALGLFTVLTAASCGGSVAGGGGGTGVHMGATTSVSYTHLTLPTILRV